LFGPDSTAGAPALLELLWRLNTPP
jgi:hypothetical protein